MLIGARDEPFAAFVSAYRDRLLGTAFLVHLDPERAGVLTEVVLARLYAAWPRLDDPYAYAIRAVVDPTSAGIGLPGHAVDHFALVDVDAATPRFDDDIVHELAALSDDERRTLVLASFTRLPLVGIAGVLDRDVSEVIAQLRAATDRLQTMPRTHARRHLTTELAAAAALRRPESATDAPEAGRALLRHRRLKFVAVAAVLIVVAGLGIRQAVPLLTPVASRGPEVITTPATTSAPAPPCDVKDARCRAEIVSSWRSEMADVMSSYLDPKGVYFTASSYSYVSDAEGSGFWNGGEGALGLELYRASGGATVVSLQIATSRQSALPCGQITKRECHGIRFMDGNRFTLTDPADVARGLEAQHRPAGTFVITIVARNTSKAGRELPVTRADLVNLVGDERLRLPPR